MNDLPFNYINKDYTEKELIDKFIVDNDSCINYHLIKILLENPFSSENIKFYNGYYIYQNILRTELGFDKYSKPGDFDILIIPFNNEKIYFERTSAFEVKVVRPSRKKPLKNANSLGTTQVWGLINDGFPLVGLVHLSLTEPLKDYEKQKLRLGNISGIKNEDELAEILVDLFSCWSAKNQMKRLISTDLPKYVGLSCIGINTTNDNHLQLSISLYENCRYETGYFNPKKLLTTIDKIETFHYKNQDKCIIAKPHYKK